MNYPPLLCGVQLATHMTTLPAVLQFSTFPSYLQTTICYHLFFLEFHVLFLFFLHQLYKMMIKTNQLVVSMNELNFLVLPIYLNQKQTTILKKIMNHVSKVRSKVIKNNIRQLRNIGFNNKDFLTTERESGGKF